MLRASFRCASLLLLLPLLCVCVCANFFCGSLPFSSILPKIRFLFLCSTEMFSTVSSLLFSPSRARFSSQSVNGRFASPRSISICCFWAPRLPGKHIATEKFSDQTGGKWILLLVFYSLWWRQFPFISFILVRLLCIRPSPRARLLLRTWAHLMGPCEYQICISSNNCWNAGAGPRKRLARTSRRLTAQQMKTLAINLALNTPGQRRK